MDTFEKRLDEFAKFVVDNKLDELKHTQYELTYVNHIPKGEGWEKVDELGKVFPDCDWRKSSDRFLPISEDFQWRTAYVLPDAKGRLRASVSLARRPQDGHPIIILELAARGFSSDTSNNQMREWFDLAHDWIVRGFADITGNEIQQNVWQRK